MTDPRNIAHDKRVSQEKKHHGIHANTGTHHAPQPGKKPHIDPVENGLDHGPDGDEAIDKTESGIEP